MAETEIEFQPSNAPKKGFKVRWDATKKSLYNNETGQICGRTPKSWVQITLFYFIFYASLAAFFAAMLAMFFTTIDDHMPKQTGMNSLIKGNPGMAFRPMPNVESTLISFKQGQPDTFKKYTDNIKAVLTKYEEEHSKYEYENCTAGRVESDLPCKFDLSLLGTECTEENYYGFFEGQPCILLKLNKVYGWIPVALDNSSLPEVVGDDYNGDGVYVSCQGENFGDIDNMGTISSYPAQGFLGKFFPFKAEKHYQAPLVFVRFDNIVSGVISQIWCKAWADNIYHHKYDKAGSTHFEILVD